MLVCIVIHISFQVCFLGILLNPKGLDFLYLINQGLDYDHGYVIDYPYHCLIWLIKVFGSNILRFDGLKHFLDVFFSSLMHDDDLKASKWAYENMKKHNKI